MSLRRPPEAALPSSTLETFRHGTPRVVTGLDKPGIPVVTVTRPHACSRAMQEGGE